MTAKAFTDQLAMLAQESATLMDEGRQQWSVDSIVYRSALDYARGHPPRPEVRGFHLTHIIAAIGHRAQRPQEPLVPPPFKREVLANGLP